MFSKFEFFNISKKKKTPKISLNMFIYTENEALKTSIYSPKHTTKKKIHVNLFKVFKQIEKSYFRKIKL